MVGLSVAVVVFGASAVPAGADTIPGTQSQLQALQAQVQAGAGKIARLTLAYQQADTQAASLTEQVAADQTQVSHLQAQLTAASNTLRTDAIDSYIGGDMNADSNAPDAEAVAVGQEYLTIASGDLQDATDQYRTQEDQVAAAQAQLTSELRASQAAETATDSARRQAIDEAEQVQGQVTALQGQLASLEAMQAAAQAEAASEAAAKAAAAAATQGLPVNNGLVTAVQTVTTSGGNAGGDWLRLRECESGDNYQENTGNGFYGAYQFSWSTWTNMGFPGRPDQEPPAMQDQAAQELQARSGWGQWPACSAALGLS